MNTLKFDRVAMRVVVLVIFLGIFVMNGNAAYISKIYDLPKIEAFETEVENNQRSGETVTVHLNLGVMVDDQFSLFGIPLWNEGEPKYVLYHQMGTVHTSKFDFTNYLYIDLNEDDVAAIEEMVPGLDVPSNPQLPFWDRIGGKLVFLLILIAVFGVLYVFCRKKKEDEEDD